MINAISIALTGLNAASTRLNVSANNIANSLTENYTPLDTQLKSQGIGGVTTTIIERSPPFENDLATEIVDMKMAELAYKANLNTIKVSGELFDELLNAFDDESS